MIGSTSFSGFIVAVAFISCSTVTQHESAIQTTPVTGRSSKDTTPRVTGIGGIFFLSADPAAAKNWYGKNLGLAIVDHGSNFEFRNAHRPEEINYLAWSPFPEKTTYFLPSKKDFMINYRVNNLEGLVRNLKKNNVVVLDSIVSYDYGKFVHIIDPEGNKIELWEPVDHVLTKMGGMTTK